ncbi:MAG: DUF4838 domain-containing protein [Clostridia bacterium]|nr:DUF4838 domain-containing protein [Clostridia bacterium]
MTKRKMMAMQTDELYCGGFVHTLSGLISIDKYYDEHPEYFSGRKDWQPCLTNPEVFQIVLASVRERLEQYPNAKLISISQNDYPTQCTCENCLKVDAEEGSRAGAMLRFVNAIAEAIAEDYPDVVIDTLAYQNTRALPLITRPRENVQIRLCAIECCYMHSIDDPNCKRNRSFMEDLKAWSEVSEHLAIWEYTTNFDSYCSLHPNLEVLNDNMETYAQYGVDSIFCEANAKGVSGEFGVLKAYLLSKLQWDPYMTEEEYQYHINDFLECYYGPGWQVMRDLLDDLTSNALEQGGHVVAVGDRQFYPYYGFEPEDLEKIKADWAEARELALDDAQRLHLDRSYVSVLMAEASYYFYHMFDDPSNKQKFYDMIEYVKGIAIPLGIPHSYDSEMTAW